MAGNVPRSIAQWLQGEARHIALDGVVQAPQGRTWVGKEHPLTGLEEQFLECPLDRVAHLVLEEWASMQDAPTLLPSVVPAFRDLFSEIEEIGCMWPAHSGADTSTAFLVGRTNPGTGEPLFLIFEPGVGVDATREFEAEVGMTFPDELRAVYATFGYIQAGGPHVAEGLVGLRRGLALGNVLAEHESWLQWCIEVGEEDDTDVHAFKDYVPLYANGCGDYVVWLGRNRSETEPEVWFFSHDSLELYECSANIPRFLQDLITQVHLGAEEAFYIDV